MNKRFPNPYSDPRWWWSGDYIPACFECAHFQGALTGLPRCKAFPDGIPRELMKRDAKHTMPLPGDHGLRFEQYISENERRKLHET